MKPIWSPSSPKAASVQTKRKRGFTLAEMLIAVTIATFVLAGATSMFILFARTNMTMAARSEYDRQLRTVIHRLGEDTREAATARANGNNQIALTMPQGRTPQVIYYTYNAQTDQLTRAEDSGADVVMLRDCTNFSVSVTNDQIVYTIQFSKSIGGQVIDLDRELTITTRN